MRVINLKPSLFIIHDVKHAGGISYKISDRETQTENRTELTNWRTDRTISDLDAFNAARATRSRIENLMKSETGAAVSDITGGLFAPDSPETWEALKTAQEKVQEEIENFRRDFDGGNRLTSRVIVFKISGENRQILEALSDQIQDGLEALKEAVSAADPTRIRAALKSMKGIDRVMNPAAAARLSELMEKYKKTAREISAEIKKTGKSIDEMRQEMNTSPIDAAQLAIFEDAPETIEALPTMDAGTFQVEEADDAPALELTPSPDPRPKKNGALDFETDDTDEAPAEAPRADGLRTDDTPTGDPGAEWEETSDPDPDPAPGEVLDLDAIGADAIDPREAARLIRQDAREAARAAQ